jgi:hypothetical protein
MAAAAGARQRMGRATLASVTIHVLAALAIPALAWTASTAPPVETITFARILHVEIKPPRAPHPPPQALAPRHDVKPAINFATHIHLVSAKPHRRASPEPIVATAPAGAPAVAAEQRAGETTGDGNVAPNATPSPLARTVASVGSHQVGGYLPFGAEQPVPVLDPGVRKQLDSMGAHVTLIVTVGDDGRTENIVFEPAIESSLEDRIRSLLADANWDPAVCGGGVACQGQATIKL